MTEAAYCIERAMDILAQKLNMDPAELRMKNFIRRDQFPYQSALGWEYDSGDYHTAMKQGMEKIGYQGLRAEQKRKQADFKARVRALPEDGAANAALEALAAKWLGVPKSSVRLVCGGKSRVKSLVIGGDVQALEGRLRAVISAEKAP